MAAYAKLVLGVRSVVHPLLTKMSYLRSTTFSAPMFESTCISQRKVQTRIGLFAAGEWNFLMEVSDECAKAGVDVKVRAPRRSGRDKIKSGIRRADTLVQSGDLLVGRQALDGADFSPERRAPAPRDTLAVQPQFHRGFESWILSCSACASRLSGNNVQNFGGPRF